MAVPLLGRPRFPGHQSVGEAPDNKLIDDIRENKRGKNRSPRLDQRDEGRRIVNVPVVGDGGSDGRKPERVDHGFIMCG